MKTGCYPLMICSVLVLSASCSKDKSDESGNASIRVTFVNLAGHDTMQLGSIYHNTFGEDLSFQKFKYYISNIRFTEYPSGRTINAPETYHLVDQADPSTYSFLLQIPITSLSGITYLLGVDSTRNLSGAQTGDLDPTRDMFWTWNSGYIMAKIEGNSTFSSVADQAVTLHIGGFRTGEDVTRNISLPFPSGSNVRMEDGKTTQIFINADALTWFSGAHDLKIAEHPTCTTPGILATNYADNYTRMFTLGSVYTP